MFTRQKSREGEALTCSRANVDDFDMNKLYFFREDSTAANGDGV